MNSSHERKKMEQEIFPVPPTSYFLGTFLWSALAGLVLFQILRKWALYRRMPPGPYGFPIFGSMFHLKKVNALEEFQKYKKKYGNIFSFSAGNHYVIVINGYKAVQEVSKLEVFSGRPNFKGWSIRNFGVKNRGILLCDAGPVWQEQRRFALRSLKDFGFGKESMEGMILHELNELVKVLQLEIGKPLNLIGSFNASVLNSLWSILTGKRYELDDPKFQTAITLIIENMRLVKLTHPGLFYPWLAMYNLVQGGAYKRVVKSRLQIRELIDEHINSHHSTYNENITRDFIDAYFHELGKPENQGSSFDGEEGDLNLKVVLHDLFVAGAETTSTTLLWAVLFLTENMEVQRKVQEEVDRVIGNRSAQRDDKPNMIYLEAFLNEVHRMSSLLPMSVYHKMLKDTEFNGHHLPKDSVVFLNIHDVHHDPDIWGDAEVFRPERFLDESGTKLVKREELMQFGAGKRQCLGELLARDTLFIFLAGLVQNFNFEADPDCKVADTKGSPTFISFPKPFKVIISKRQ